MSDSLSEFPPFEEAPFELRFTEQALEDLGCSKRLSRGDLEGATAASPYGWIVRLFRKKYEESPYGTGIPIANVVRPDIVALHGPLHGRAATWFDIENGVCWFLAFTPEHLYKLFEDRASRGELLPSKDDYSILIVERETADFDSVFGPAVAEMLKVAISTPGVSVRRTVDALLQIELTVLEVEIEGRVLREVFLTVRVPPLTERRPAGWPSKDIPKRLMELATRYSRSRLSLRDPDEVPNSSGGFRPVNWQHELATQACSLEYSGDIPESLLDDDGRAVDYDVDHRGSLAD
ncbi:MAG: hypothetical protein ACYC0I_00345 [Acidimicrobiales bacterium]